MDYLFGFKEKHSTIEQVHRITYVTENDLEEKKLLRCLPGCCTGSVTVDWSIGYTGIISKNTICY